MSLEEAIEKAVNECIRNGILRDFLMHQKAEVVKMSIYEYDEKEEQRRLYNEAYEDGEIAGEARGETRGKANGEAKIILEAVERLCDKNIADTIEKACEILDIPLEKYESAKKLVGETLLSQGICEFVDSANHKDMPNHL